MSGAASYLESLLLTWPRSYAKLRRLLDLSDPDRAAFCELVSRGSLVIEAGASTGHYTMLLARLVGARGKVIAFEPNPEARMVLLKRLEAAGLVSEVEVYSQALTNEEGAAVLTWPGGDSGQSSLRLQSSGSWASAAVEEHTVTTICLDNFLGGRPRSRVSLLKLDVEGAELPALLGAQATIDEDRPVIHLEVCAAWQRAFGYGPVDLREWLKGRGYDQFFWVGDGGFPARGVISEPPDASANAVCLCREVHRDLLGRLGWRDD